MKQFAVIGLGIFGSTVARNLVDMGQEVLAIDKDAALVNDIKDDVTQAVRADPTDEDVIRALGLRNFDVVIVAIGEDIQSSVLISVLCKDMGVPYLVARACSATHAKVLHRVGVDRVVFPEQDTAARVSHALVSSSVLDVVELSEEYALVELQVPAFWEGKTLRQLNMRAAYGLNVIAVTQGEKTLISPAPDDVLRPGDGITVVGSNADIRKLEARLDAPAQPARFK